MNVCLGVCGMGYGHSLRESSVASELLRRGHRLALLGFGCSNEIFAERLPQIPRFEVWRPWVPASAGGIEFGRAGADPRNRGDGVADNFRVMDAVVSLFGGAPDLVISDYCPVAAQLAYACGRPLITIDGHSKFLGYQFPSIGGFSPNEERARLRLFFPQAALRIAVSFFRVPWPREDEYRVELIPPILRAEFGAESAYDTTERPGSVLVYLSPYSGNPRALEEAVSVLRECPEWRFTVYARGARAESLGHVAVRPFDAAAFARDLRRSAAVISNAGGNVLYEALCLGKPVLAIPFDTYEQHCNALMIVRYGFGASCPALGRGSVVDFMERLESFRASLREGSRGDGGLVTPQGLTPLMSFLGRFGL